MQLGANDVSNLEGGGLYKFDRIFEICPHILIFHESTEIHRVLFITILILLFWVIHVLDLLYKNIQKDFGAAIFLQWLYRQTVQNGTKVVVFSSY